MVTRPITLKCLNGALLCIQPGSVVYGDALKIKAADKSISVRVKLRFVDGHVLTLDSRDFGNDANGGLEFDDILNQLFGTTVGKLEFCDDATSPLPFSKATPRKASSDDD